MYKRWFLNSWKFIKNETDSNILIKIHSLGKMEFFSDRDCVTEGEQIVDTLKTINGIQDNIIKCKKRIAIDDFVIVPIN